MGKTKVIKGNKQHASKIRMFFESLSEYRSNPCKLTCDCDNYSLISNKNHELYVV